jgi:hypothetical protein
MIRKLLIAGCVVWAVFLVASVSRQDGNWWGRGERGSGTERKESRKVDTFTAIEVGGAFTVEVVCGQSPSLEITGDDNLLQYIETNVRGGTLSIETKRSISPKSKMHIRITTQDLKSLQSSGASEVTLSNVNNEKLHLQTSGAGSVTASVKTAMLEIKTSGAGNVRVNGTAKTLSVQTSGAAEIKAKDLSVHKAQIGVSGAGDVELTVADELDVRVSGAGDVRYYGDPKIVTKEISGAGSVKKKG